MSAHEKIIQKFDRLLQEATQILGPTGWDGSGYHGAIPKDEDYIRFRTEAMTLIRRVCGEESDHYKVLFRLSTDSNTARNSWWFPHCSAVVQAARRDYDDGMLFDLRAMVAAEVLGGFIEQAQALLVQGYYAPAASLAGAVLEDTLRKLCDVKSIPYPEKTTINFLNTELTRATVYDLLINKQIIAYADIRKGLA